MGLGRKGRRSEPECRSTGWLMVLMKSSRCKTQSVVGSRALWARPLRRLSQRSDGAARHFVHDDDCCAQELAARPGRHHLYGTLPELCGWRGKEALIRSMVAECKRRRSLAAIEASAPGDVATSRRAIAVTHPRSRVIATDRHASTRRRRPTAESVGRARGNSAN